jgi:hypothetical protein
VPSLRLCAESDVSRKDAKRKLKAQRTVSECGSRFALKQETFDDEIEAVPRSHQNLADYMARLARRNVERICARDGSTGIEG